MSDTQELKESFSEFKIEMLNKNKIFKTYLEKQEFISEGLKELTGDFIKLNEYVFYLQETLLVVMSEKDILEKEAKEQLTDE